MTDKEKGYLMHIAYNNIETILNDTDEDLWAYKYLEDALVALEFWFEESEV